MIFFALQKNDIAAVAAVAYGTKLGFFHKKNDKNYFIAFAENQQINVYNYLNRAFWTYVSSGNFIRSEVRRSYMYLKERIPILVKKCPRFFENNDIGLVTCEKQYIRMIDAALNGENVHTYVRATFGTNTSEESQKSFQILLDNINLLSPAFFQNLDDGEFACDSTKYKVVIADGIEQFKLEKSKKELAKGRARTAELLQAEARIIGGEGDEAIAISKYNMQKNSRKARDNKMIELDSQQDYEANKKDYARGSRARENISSEYKRISLHDEDNKSFLASILDDDYYLNLESEAKKAKTKKRIAELEAELKKTKDCLLDALQEKDITKQEFKKLSCKMDTLSEKLESHNKKTDKQHSEQVKEHTKTQLKVDSISTKLSKYFSNLSEQLDKVTDISSREIKEFRSALDNLQKNFPSDTDSYEQARDRLYAIYDHDRASSCYALIIRLDLERSLNALEEPIKLCEKNEKTGYIEINQNATLANFLDSSNLLTAQNCRQQVWTKIQRDGKMNRKRLHNFIHYDSDFLRKAPEIEIEDLNQSMNFFRDKGLISFGKVKLKPVVVPPKPATTRKNINLHTGTILQYFADRGFGFIKDKTVGGEVYFHVGQFLSKDVVPAVGLEVEFETQPAKKDGDKPIAIKTRLVNK